MIEIGEYIRTNNGTIAKIKDIESEIKTNMFGQILYEIFAEGNIYYEVIVKHSKNIIDLIEVGDIVKTGVETIFITAFEDKENLEYFKELYKNDQDTILSILTHQQYEQNSYKIGE